MLDRNSLPGEDEYVKAIQSHLDYGHGGRNLSLSSYYILDLLNSDDLRRIPLSKLIGSNPHKYGSWWRGPYQKKVRSVIQIPVNKNLT